jgi:glyoxylase-like metal-dependent hydrolase (beta-lactamase superfamily II)
VETRRALRIRRPAACRADGHQPAGAHQAPGGHRVRYFGETFGRPSAEILPGIRTVNAAGHTPGHSAILLESAGERLLCAGDSFYDPLQLSHPGWWTPWDTDAPRSVHSRLRLLNWAADENLLVHAYHLPFPGLGRVTRHRGAFRWHPAGAG